VLTFKWWFVDGSGPSVDIGGIDEEHSRLATVASVPLMITRDMRRTLIEDLNYSRKEVNKLKPEEAVEIIRRGVRNPAKEFSRPGTTSSSSDTAEEAIDLSISGTSAVLEKE